MNEYAYNYLLCHFRTRQHKQEAIIVEIIGGLGARGAYLTLAGGEGSAGLFMSGGVTRRTLAERVDWGGDRGGGEGQGLDRAEEGWIEEEEGPGVRCSKLGMVDWGSERNE